MTLGDPEQPQTTLFSTFLISFYIFVVHRVRDFKFGRQFDSSKS